MARSETIAIAEDRRSHVGSNDNSRGVRQAVDPITGENVDATDITRNGGIEDMLAKGSIIYKQKAAADRFLALYEAAHSDGLKAIDYARVRVDGSSGSKGASLDKSVQALRELEALRNRVGDADYAVLLTVVIRGWSLRQVGRALAKHAGGDESWKRKLAKQALIRALDALDDRWGAPPIVEARTNGGARFVEGVARSRDIAALKQAGLA